MQTKQPQSNIIYNSRLLWFLSSHTRASLKGDWHTKQVCPAAHWHHIGILSIVMMSEGASGDTTGLELDGVIGTEETPVNTLQRSAEEEEGTTTRRKRKKKKKEIIYRSDLEDDDAGEGTSANVDGTFSPPHDEGENMISAGELYCNVVCASAVKFIICLFAVMG